MRLLRIAGGAAAGLLLLVTLAAYLAPRVLDWNRYRDEIASVASTALGRPVQITGPVSLTLVPHPVLVASGVVLAELGDGASAEVPELRLQVALRPLLSGRLEAEDLTLHGARMHLPWPLRPGMLQQAPLAFRTGLRGRVEDGSLMVGGLTVSGVAGTLSVDPLTGTVSVDGLAAALGRRWRVTARLGRAGGDGSAPLEMSLDSQGPAPDAAGDGAPDPAADTPDDTGGTLSGQLAADGSLTGRVTGRGRDLSQVIAGPNAPWHAAGRFRGGDGLALADDLDLEIGGVPSRGAVALRLAPAARLDAALATSRLDLDAWLPNLLRGAATAVPTSVDLSAEAASFAGGTLRHLRAAFDLAQDGVSVRDAEMVLPGDAALTLSGRLAGGTFTGAARIIAPALQETLRWLAPAAPALAAVLPPDALQTADLAADVTVAGGRAAFDGLSGRLDGAGITGALSVLPGEHPALVGALTVTGLNLDPWAPRPPAGLAALEAGLSGWPGRWGGVDIALALSATHPRWRGAVLDWLVLDGALHAGTLTLRRAALARPDFTVEMAGTLAPGGQIADGRLSVPLDRAAAVLPWLPPNVPAALFTGPAALQARAAGPPGALGLRLQTKLGDVQLDMEGKADLRKPGWAGTLDLQHPGAPRLLEALGVPGAASWLGDGSFSLVTAGAVTPDQVALNAFKLSAGMLRTTGTLTLDRGHPPSLTAQFEAETLPLPLPYLRSPEPLPLDALLGWRAQLGVRAAHVLFGLSPGLDHVAASVSLADGALRVTELTGAVADGQFAGTAELDVAAPPRLLVQGALHGATLSGPLLDGTLDVLVGRLDVQASLRAAGYSPGGLLATLEGAVQASVADGVLAGLDLAALDAALDQKDAATVQAGIVQALQGGTTAFTRLTTNASVHAGAVALGQTSLTSPAGDASLSGTLDLPIDAADLRWALHPARAGAPEIGLRVIGHAANPRRTPELARLSGWLAER